jgi:hypothetical protein
MADPKSVDNFRAWSVIDFYVEEQLNLVMAPGVFLDRSRSDPYHCKLVRSDRRVALAGIFDLSLFIG